jgi:hypothetical protein
MPTIDGGVTSVAQNRQRRALTILRPDPAGGIMSYQARANLNRIVIIAALLVTVVAIVQELLKSPDERTWHGKAIGFVPYDFRAPTLERVRAAYWNPDDPRLFTDKVIGVGWAVNIPALFRFLRSNGILF